MGREGRGLGKDGAQTVVERMSLSEIVTRRAADYGLDRAEDLAAAIGMSYQYVRVLMAGGLKRVGIKARRALVNALDIDPEVIERSVRENA